MGCLHVWTMSRGGYVPLIVFDWILVRFVSPGLIGGVSETGRDEHSQRGEHIFDNRQNGRNIPDTPPNSKRRRWWSRIHEALRSRDPPGTSSISIFTHHSLNQADSNLFVQLLYLVETVFPSPEIREKMISSSSSGFTLKAGLYEYPFKIRIPINSNCGNDPNVGGLLNRLSFDKGSIEYAKDASRHVKGTLPPSLSGIPDDEAWIRYFLKVTVNRPQFYRSSMRSVCPHSQPKQNAPLTLHSTTLSSSSPSSLPARPSSTKPTPGGNTKYQTICRPLF